MKAENGPTIEPHTPKGNGQLIAIFCNSFPPETGAAAGRIYNLAVLLRNAGYRVQVVCAMPNYPSGQIFPRYRGKTVVDEVWDGINVKRLWLSPSNSSKVISRGRSLLSFIFSLRTFAYRRILKQDPALIIVSSPPLPMAVDVARFYKKHGLKVLLNVSDLWPLSASALGAKKNGFLYRWLQKMEHELYALADAFTAQSEAILEHIRKNSEGHKPSWLYRNLPATTNGGAVKTKAPAMRIIYPGVLGHAQGIYELCRNIDFSGLGLELHIYGEGLELRDLKQLITAESITGIVLHQPVSTEQLHEILPDFRAMLIPLITEIEGAVPSKLFTAIQAGIPVLFCAGSEGADLVKQHRLGWTSGPGDYAALEQNLQAMKLQRNEDHLSMRDRIASIGTQYFNKRVQDEKMLRFIAQLLS